MSTLYRPGARIEYTDSGGDGPAIVLTHGAGMDHSAFSEQADALRGAGFRAVLWDLRGHGGSALDQGARFTASDALGDLDALIDACGLEQPILIGHSLGGNLSQAFVRRHPGRTGGLIAVGTTWNTGPLTRGERIGLRVAAPMLRLIPASKLPGLMADASAVTPGAVEAIRTTFARMPKAVFLDVWRATASIVGSDPEYHSPVPLGLIVGAEDRTGNIRTAMQAWADAERVRLHAIPGAGHVVMSDAPEAVSAAIVGILREWGAAAR